MCFVCYMCFMCYMCPMTHSYVCHDSLMCASRLPHMSAMTQWYVSRIVCYSDSICWCIYGTRLVYIWHDHMCAMPHWIVCHDSLICVPWRFHTCAMTHWYALCILCYSASICLCICGTRIFFIWNDCVCYAKFVRGRWSQNVCCSAVLCG